jgi:hypothetical protein
MWILQTLRKRQYLRNFNAALVTFLGHFTYLQLGPDERKRVDVECTALRVASSTPATTDSQYMRGEGKAQIRALAMQRLGIPPAADSVEWSDILHRGWFWTDTDLFNDFHPFRAATEDAKLNLRKYSIEIGDTKEFLGKEALPK